MRSHKEKIDLLSLSPKERRRIIRKIRAALKERVAEAKTPTFWAFEEVAIAEPTQIDPRKKQSLRPEDPPEGKSIWESLVSRLF
jgi:hypothetical protein